jgi:hypothetical protein
VSADEHRFTISNIPLLDRFGKAPCIQALAGL